MKKTKQYFHFQPFSRKQRQVLNWWTEESPVKDCDGIIADGAIRSGKTVSMSLSFVLWAMSSFQGQNFAMCGKTIGSFRRNVLFWLKLMLKSRGYRVSDHRSDNLVVISKGDVENYFYIFGGKDERSQDLIQGITLAGVFFDEVALMPESFVNQAKKAKALDEVPIGCVIVYEDKIIARGYNRRNTDKNTLSHAELNAIRKASKKLGDWRLEGCTMYITLEPCQMCAGAIVQARVSRVVIGSMNPKAGCAGSVLNILQMDRFNHQVELTKGVLQEECSTMLSDFFKELREKKKVKFT